MTREEAVDQIVRVYSCFIGEFCCSAKEEKEAWDECQEVIKLLAPEFLPEWMKWHGRLHKRQSQIQVIWNALL